MILQNMYILPQLQKGCAMSVASTTINNFNNSCVKNKVENPPVLRFLKSFKPVTLNVEDTCIL